MSEIKSILFSELSHSLKKKTTSIKLCDVIFLYFFKTSLQMTHFTIKLVKKEGEELKAIINKGAKTTKHLGKNSPGKNS